MFNCGEVWTQVRDLEEVEFSNWGRLKSKGNFKIPFFNRHFNAWGYRVKHNGKKHFLNIRMLFLNYFPRTHFRINRKWANKVIQKNKLETPKEEKMTRKCHDCGKPTNNYRCQECWNKIRNPERHTGKTFYMSDPDPDVPHY